MWRYVVRRLLLGVMTVVAISFVVFTLSYLLPEKPYAALVNRPNQSQASKDRILHRFGADKPFLGQYGVFARNLTKPLWTWAFCSPDGVDNYRACAPHRPEPPDLGESVDLHDSVAHAIALRAPATIVLMGSSYIFQLLIAIPIGVLSAVRQYSKLDNVVTTLSFVGISLPNYWFASLLIFAFAIPHGTHAGVLPVGGTGDLSFTAHGLADVSVHLVLPVIVLAVQGIAVYARYTRSSMLDVLSQDYVRTAKAKGLSGRAVVLRHAFRNSLLPLITLFGLELPQLFVGAVITEFVFNWHGMGQLFVNQIEANDLPTVVGLVLVLSVFVVIGNLCADLAYTKADPRISYEAA
ncbi:MAG: ABC transporter permease [Candidatus Dormibacteria bacterium]